MAKTECDLKITAMDISSDNEFIAWGDGDGTLYLSNPKSIEPPLVFNEHHFSTINSINFFPSNKVILTGSSDFTVFNNFICS